MATDCNKKLNLTKLVNHCQKEEHINKRTVISFSSKKVEPEAAQGFARMSPTLSRRKSS